MTRDEAITKIYDNRNSRITASDLDLFVALGMLKLDEPKLESRESPTYRAYDAIFEFTSSLDFQTFRDLIKSAGLQIIEKQGQ